MKIALINIFLFFALFCKAQPVIIQGKADVYKGEIIGAYFYDDLITKRENLQDIDTITSSGDFTLKLETKIIQRIFIKINNQKAHIYIQPGKTYHVIFPPKDTSRYVNPNVEHVENLIIKTKDSLSANYFLGDHVDLFWETIDINNLIIDYNEQFEFFWEQNYQYFIAKKAKPAIDTFRVHMQKRYEKVRNDFFQTYVEYSIASLKENTLQSPNALIYEYIVKRPIYYSSYEYMEFFNSAFKQFLNLYALTPEGAAVVTEINTNTSYEGLMTALSYHKFLKNDTLRELVMLKGLNELLGNKQFKKDNILNILSQVQANSKVFEHRKIAFNILNAQSGLKTGSIAPDFMLPDKAGKAVSLNELNGKYIYLNFWDSECTACLREMKVIPELKKKYGDKITFISISMDKDIEVMKAFLVKNPTFNWNVLFAGKQSKVAGDYNVRALPTFYLINPQGKFDQCPAEHPGMIEPYFKAIKKVK